MYKIAGRDPPSCTRPERRPCPCCDATPDDVASYIIPCPAMAASGTAIPACALQGIAARWLSAHYKDIARVIARAMARGLGFVTPCPNKQGKNAYFSKVSDASGTASDVVNVRKDYKHFGPPLPCVRATGYCTAMAQCALKNYSARHSARYSSGSWVCNPMS